MFSDYHVHSDYSDDSWYLMEEVVTDAVKLGLNEICFTDHVDFGVKPDWQESDDYLVGGNQVVKNVHYKRYVDEIASLKKKYRHLINIKLGMEFGMQVVTIPQFQDLFNRYDFDFILMSIHQVDNQEFWSGDFQAGKTVQQCYDRYYEEMLALVTSYKDYSCLAHMDLLRRYLSDKSDWFAHSKDIITKILKVVIADGKGIEVNTSSKRYKVDGLTPSIEILKLYRQLGGTVITIGSDSHKPDHLGFDIKESMQLLKELGYEHYCTFEKMVPIFHQL